MIVSAPCWRERYQSQEPPRTTNGLGFMSFYKAQSIKWLRLRQKSIAKEVSKDLFRIRITLGRNSGSKFRNGSRLDRSDRFDPTPFSIALVS